jgi:hypothetical protein
MGCSPEHLWPAVNYSLASPRAHAMTIVTQRTAIGRVKPTPGSVGQLDHVVHFARRRDPSSRFAISAKRVLGKERQTKPSPDPIVSTLIT